MILAIECTGFLISPTVSFQQEIVVGVSIELCLKHIQNFHFSGCWCTKELNFVLGGATLI